MREKRQGREGARTEDMREKRREPEVEEEKRDMVTTVMLGPVVPVMAPHAP